MQLFVFVGGIFGIQFVGVVYLLDGWVGYDVVEELQVVVVGNVEDFRDVEFGELVEQVVVDGVDGIVVGIVFLGCYEDDCMLDCGYF